MSSEARVNEVLTTTTSEHGPVLLPPDESVPSLPVVRPAVAGYEILGELGRGGMGVVYRARQLGLNRTVALKMILAGGHAGPAIVARFRTEAEAVARLQHPNIVQIHEVGEVEGRPYFSMEFCPGGNLATRLASTPQPPRKAAQLVELLARAIHVAHQAGIVHRDLKPGNILLAPAPLTHEDNRGPGGERARWVLKITDFGLAKRVEETGFTATQAIMGTPSYMAPEQARGESRAVTPATDVYALGAILYEVLTGLPPFIGATMLETLEQVLSKDPVPPSRLQPKVPRDLEVICLKCLAKDPGQRYASGKALAEDLRRFLAGDAILARPMGPVERLARAVKRRPAVAGMVLTVALAAATLGIVGLGLTLQLKAERDAAQRERDNARQERAEADRQRELAAQGQAEADRQKELAAQRQAEADRQRALAEQRKAEADAERERAERGEKEAHQQLDRVRRTALTMQLWRVAAAWEHDPEFGLHLLEDTQVCPLDLRDPAWRFFHRLCKQEARTLSAFAPAIGPLAWSPDGKLLASEGGVWNPQSKQWEFKEVKLWDVASSQERATLKGHTGKVVSVAFAPDGKMLASGSEDQTIRLWDVATGAERGVLKTHTGTVTGLAFAPGGRLLASGSADKTVKLWDPVTRQEQRTLNGHSDAIQVVAFSPDGKTLASAGQDGKVRLWNTATGGDRGSLEAQRGAIACVAWAPDGRTLAAGADDGSITLWDTPSEGKRIFTGHRAPVLSLAWRVHSGLLASGSADGVVKLWYGFGGGQELRTLIADTPEYGGGVAFAPDGNSLASARSGTIKLWTIIEGPERASLKPPSGAVSSVALTADGRMLAAGSASGTVQLWDARTGELRGSFREDPGAWVYAVAFTPDGTVLASGGGDGKVRLWDVATGKELRVIAAHSEPVWSLAFSPDGKTVASGSKDHKMKVWEVSTGRELVNMRSSHPGEVKSVAFAPDGKTLASGSDDSTAFNLKLWDSSTGDKVLGFKGHSGGVTSLTFSPDSKVLVTAGGDKTVRLWDVATGNELQTLTGHADTVTCVSFTADGKTLASGSQDKTVKLWDVATGQERATLRGHRDAITSVMFARDGETLASGSGDFMKSAAPGEVKLWDMASGQDSTSINGHTSAVQSVTFSRNGNIMASAGDTTVKLWDVVTGQELSALPAHRGGARSVAFSPDGKILVSGGWDTTEKLVSEDKDATAKLWEVGTGKQLAALNGHTGKVYCVAFSPDGKTVASGGEDGVVKLWDAATGKERRSLNGHSGVVRSVAFAPDGKMLASGSLDKTIKLWDVATGQELYTLKGHTHSVFSVAFRPDGKVLASGSWDKTIKLWDTGTGQELRTLKGHTVAVWAVAFTADGETLISGGGGPTDPETIQLPGELKLWSATTGQEKASRKTYPGWVNSLSLSPDGKTLAAGSTAPFVKLGEFTLWDMTRLMQPNPN
jgi:WD40 repeat protein